MSVESQSVVDARMDIRAMLAAVWRRLPRILLVTILLLAAVWGVLHLMPRLYESSASLLVAPRENAFTRPSGEVSGQPDVVDQSTMSSQIQLIQSRDTLLPVVKQLKLDQVPEFNGTEETALSKLFAYLGRKPAGTPTEIALRTLYSRLTVVQQRDSSVVTILVRAENPDLAAQIANAIADQHVKRQTELVVSDTADASAWLKSQIDQMRKQVADAEAKVANFKINNDLYTGSNNTKLTDQQLTDIQNQITAAQGRKNDAQSRADLIRKLLASGKPIDGVSDVRNSAVVQQLSEQKASLVGQKAQLLATLLPNHPSVKAIDAQIAAIDQQIDAEGKHIADSLAAEAQVEASIEAQLRENLARAKQSSAQAAKNGVTLDQLEREAAAQRNVLDSYLTRYREATSRAGGSGTLPDVRVVTRAAPSVSPASPKTKLILAATGFVSLALQIGAVIFAELISGRAIIEQRVTTPGPLYGALYVGDTEIREVRQAVERRRAIESARPEHSEADRPSDGAPDGAGEAATAAKAEPPLRPSRHPGEGPSLTGDQGSEPPAPGPAAPAADAAESARSAGQETGAGALMASAAEAFNALSADMALGRVRVVLLASLASREESERVADMLVADAVQMGLSIVRVDAASGQPTSEPGLADLAAGEASFGDVIYPGPQPGVALVPWGHRRTMDEASKRPAALIEALADLYEVVVVLVGSVPDSGLPNRLGGEARLVLVVSGDVELGAIEAARAAAEAQGFKSVQLVTGPASRAEVA